MAGSCNASTFESRCCRFVIARTATQITSTADRKIRSLSKCQQVAVRCKFLDVLKPRAASSGKRGQCEHHKAEATGG